MGSPSALNQDTPDTSQPCRGDSPFPWYVLGFHIPLGGCKVALTSLISPVMQKYCRESPPEDLHLQPSQHRAWLSSGRAPTLHEKPREGFATGASHQQNRDVGISCTSSCFRWPSGFQGPCPEQETSKSLTCTLLPNSPACSQPGTVIKQEKKPDLSRKLREEAAAIWSWRKQEHNPLASLPCRYPCFPVCLKLRMSRLCKEPISWCLLGHSPIRIT